ncbi:MAG: nucleotidyl transferase AbiEii/AbiGii toxin family protein [Lachnospiraceae bacterium]|nr:nucleotidyl transferase AbiEii/AbiGii toxin family protein [Lachnospiraceae bacterium]
MINAESVKARLKNHAKANGNMLQDELTMYGLERTIYRISISPYAKKFTLKGGIFLYALFDGEFARATTDIDLLARGTTNDVEAMKKLFVEILQFPVDDALRYDLTSLEVISITEFKKYHGVKVTVKCYLDKTRIDISLDIGFDDVIYPDRVEMEFPVLLDMEIPKIYVYSLESVIAEKFEAIVQLGYGNSRYKDFYDVYILATTHAFDGNMLKQAIIETFSHRNTGFEDVVAFGPDFGEDSIRQSRWRAFVRKKKTIVDVELEEVLELLRNFLKPVVGAIVTGENFEREWDCGRRCWKGSL